MRFVDIEGQDRAIARLRRALASGRLPHAFLFLGPEGVGKALTARALAAALVCDTATDDSCGACGPCVRAASGSHPDVAVLEPEGAGRVVKIDAIREVVRMLRFPPFEGRGRAIVLPAAERLNEEAANALLKTLEEPAPRSVLLLVAPAASALLPTVVSRCQVVRFAPLPRAVCVRRLVAQGFSNVDAGVAAALSGGSLGRALELLHSGVLEDRREVAQAVAALRKSKPSALFDLASAWTSGGDASAARDALRARLDVLGAWYRDQVVRDLEGVELAFEDLSDLPGVGTGRALFAMERVRSAREALDLHASARNVAERLLVELAA